MEIKILTENTDEERIILFVKQFCLENFWEFKLYVNDKLVLYKEEKK
jgi:hypothetical protein